MTIRSMSAAVFLSAGLALSGVALGAEPLDDGVKRERAELSSMELKPFDASLLAGLADWQNGAALNADAIKGKPVLIVSWTAWIPSSQQAVQRASEIASKNPDLIVVLAHTDNRYENAAKFLTDQNIKLPCARDVGGKLRSGLKVDADPDLYIVDRAGHLRFADIETNSLAAAIDIVVKETAEDASKIPQTLAQRAKDAAAEAARTRDITNARKPGERPVVMFEPPPASAYAKVIWPPVNQDEDMSKLGDSMMQGQVLPIKFGGTEQWLTPKVEAQDMAGKVVIVYFWSPADDARFDNVVEALARSYRNDVQVLAFSGMKRGDRMDSKIMIERALRAKPALEFGHIYDTDQKIFNDLKLREFPVVIVLSTDGVVRWAGAPIDPEFPSRVREIVTIDPGVAARRAAEIKAGIR
jgi:thiol-disulfide isomerase/thioredoxin